MSYVQADVQKWLLEKHRINISLHRLCKPVELGTINLDGEAVSLKEVVRKSVASWAAYVVDVLQEKWELFNIDHYLLAGGGAQLFLEPLRVWRSTLRAVENPVMSNVNGFSAIGHRYVKAKG
jgi:hypothetical protein